MSGIYMSHSFHPKNSKDYITVGDPYDKKKGPPNPRLKGKQFQTEPPKQGQTAGYFGTYNYKGHAYLDKSMYLGSQPRDKRKSGFGSHDARRRDEFTLDIRARQYREMLKQEDVYNKLPAKADKRTRPQSAPVHMSAQQTEQKRRDSYASKYKEQPHLFQTQVPFDLFDIGKNNSTPICNKCSRETFYCPHRVGRGTFTARRPGTATSYQKYGDFGQNHTINKPKWGKINETKHFNDRSHLQSGW